MGLRDYLKRLGQDRIEVAARSLIDQMGAAEENAVLMKKQNRTLVVVFGFIVALVVFFLIQSGTLKKNEPVAIEVTNDSDAQGPEIQENLGEALKEPTRSQGNPEEQKNFALIVTDLLNCFDLKPNLLPEGSSVQVESLLSSVQTDLGPATLQADRWMNWHLRNKENAERRVRLEINESDEGNVYRELKYYAVDKEGLPVPMELPPEKKSNPTDETLNQMLKEGDVFFKEKASYALFAGGERLEFIEKNGLLSEFEFQKGERYFRCQNLKARDACQCVR